MSDKDEHNESEIESKEFVKSEMPPPASTNVVKRLHVGCKNKCTACNQSFAQRIRLKYHIRAKHFNFKSRLPTFTKKNVNDIWFEKVLNSESVAEIKKETDNKLLVRRIESDTRTNINGDFEEIDVSDNYPTAYIREMIECSECKAVIARKDFQKHFKNSH